MPPLNSTTPRGSPNNATPGAPGLRRPRDAREESSRRDCPRPPSPILERDESSTRLPSPTVSARAEKHRRSDGACPEHNTPRQAEQETCGARHNRQNRPRAPARALSGDARLARLARLALTSWAVAGDLQLLRHRRASGDRRMLVAKIKPARHEQCSEYGGERTPDQRDGHQEKRR